MKLLKCCCFVVLVLTCLHLSNSAKIDSKSRGPDQSHFIYDDDEHEHDTEYDHEAFLGKDEAKKFDELTPEESKEKLSLIVKKIDKNEDGVVDEMELIAWIKYVQDKYILNDVDRQWKDYHGSKDSTDSLSWIEYRRRMYGESFNEDKERSQEGTGYSYMDMIRKDKRRWDNADLDKDGNLYKDEFMAFLHPEESPHMSHLAALDTLEEIDKDGDGKISLEEYLADVWPSKDKGDGEEPEWVTNEREQFLKHRDRDGDGFMDVIEVKEWIMPSDYDQSISEAKHLINEADEDQDGVLTEHEILDKYDVFVGSQATDFGEALTHHDEF